MSAAADKLGITEGAMRERLRRGIPGAVRRADGTWHIPADALEQAAGGKRPGRHRPVTLTAKQREQLGARAKDAAARIEEHRAALASAAAARQDAILALNVGGLSVRDIATELEVSATVVQTAIAEARKRLTAG